MSALLSPLAESMEQFLTHHRVLGKRFDTEAAALQLLDRYLIEQEIASVEAVTSAVLEAFLDAVRFDHVGVDFGPVQRFWAVQVEHPRIAALWARP